MAQKKQEATKSARFIDTRVPDIYAATKPGDRSNRVLVKDKKVRMPMAISLFAAKVILEGSSL
jgi:hypothetical protein